MEHMTRVLERCDTIVASRGLLLSSIGLRG